MTKLRAVVVGASSGMGEAIARRLKDDDAAVVALDLPTATWTEDSPATRFAIDVSEVESVRAAFASAASHMGGIDAVVNCAGILGPVEPTTDVSAETLQRILSVNLGGAFAVTQASLAQMLPGGFGRIVHIASIAGKEGNPQMSAYSASKAGVIGLVKSIGKEYATSGVTINAIAPALIETPLVSGMSAEQRERQTSLIPMGRPEIGRASCRERVL